MSTNTLTLSELESATRHLINDLRSKPILDSDVREAINKAARWVAGHGMCLQKSDFIQILASQQYVDVPGDYIDIEGFLLDFNVAHPAGEYANYRSIEIDFNLDNLGFRRYDYDNVGAESQAMNIHIVYPFGDKIWFEKLPAYSSPNGINLLYYAFPAKLANPNESCEILFPWVDLIPNRAAYLLAIRVEEYEKAGALLQNSDNGLKDLQAKYVIITKRMREMAKNNATG